MPGLRSAQSALRNPSSLSSTPVQGRSAHAQRQRECAQAGTENYATVASVILTALKNGQNPFEVLRVIVALAASLSQSLSADGQGRRTMAGAPE